MSPSDFPPIDLTGIAPHAATVLLQIDETCRRMGAAARLTGLSAEEHRQLAANPLASAWLVSFNLDRAAMLDADARLDAVMSLRAHPLNAEIAYFLDLYQDLVREAAGLPTAVPSEILHRAARHPFEVAA